MSKETRFEPERVPAVRPDPDPDPDPDKDPDKDPACAGGGLDADELMARAIAIRAGGSTELDLAGAERLNGLDKLWLLHPYGLALAAGCGWFLGSWGPIVLTAVLVWMLGMSGSRKGRGKELARAREREGRSLLPPSSALRAGFGVFGVMGLAALAALLGGAPGLHFYLLNGLWAGLTAVAVYRASRTDAQTGWMTGATSMAVPCTFFGIPLAVLPGLPWPIRLLPILCAASVWATWSYLSGRGTSRTKAALNALVTASVASVCYLSASTAIWGLSLFEASVHLGVPLLSFGIPYWVARERMRLLPGPSGEEPPSAVLDGPGVPRALPG
jgi:hypothetical protein